MYRTGALTPTGVFRFQVEQWMASDSTAVRMRSPHPWHHPTYAALLTPQDRAALRASGKSRPTSITGGSNCTMVSTTTGGVIDSLDGAHWETWLSTPVDLLQV